MNESGERRVPLHENKSTHPIVSSSLNESKPMRVPAIKNELNF
jgi:hypothetical protein